MFATSPKLTQSEVGIKNYDDFNELVSETRNKMQSE